MTEAPLFHVNVVNDWLRIAQPGDARPPLWLPRWMRDAKGLTQVERNFLYTGYALCRGPDPPLDAVFVGSARRLSRRFGLTEAAFLAIRDRLITKGVLVVDPIGHGLDSHHIYIVGPRP